MKKYIKTEKGSITLFVLVSMLFMTMFLVTIFTLSTNNEIARRNVTTKLKETYEAGVDKIDEIYLELSQAKAYDQYGNEIKDLEGWNIKYSSYTSGFRAEYIGEEQIDLEPYYIVVGEQEGKVTEYITLLEKVEGIDKKQIKFREAKINDATAIRNVIGEEETDTGIITEIVVEEDCNLTTTSMAHMFNNCKNLKSVDLSGINISNVTNMSNMFRDCNNIERINLSGIDATNVKQMSSMFAYCENLKELNLTDFKTEKVTTMQSMFYYCNKLEYIDLSGFKTTNAFTNMGTMFYNCFNLGWIDINGDNVRDEGDEYPELDFSGFDTSKVTNMANIFTSCINLTSLNIKSFDTSIVTNMAGMFHNCKNLKTLEIDTDKFNTSQVTSMKRMFESCNKLTTLDVSKFNTANVKDMSYMFNNCKELTTLDVSNFNGTNVETMAYMFNHCEKLEVIDFSNFKTTEKLTDIASMFNFCRVVQYLDLSSFNTSQVTNLNYLFNYCSSLKNIIFNKADGSNYFDTSNVINMSQMFRYCSKLGWIDTDGDGIMEDTDEFPGIDLTKFNTKNVEKMDSMFSQCLSVKEIKGLTSETLNENFVTDKVTTMRTMFYNCEKLEKLDLTNFNTASLINVSEVTSDNKYDEQIEYMDRMFMYCGSLKNLILGKNFIIKEPTDITIRAGYTKDENGNKVGGTTSNKSIIFDMFRGFSTGDNVYVTDSTTKEILIKNASSINVKDTSIFKDQIN